MTKKKSDDSSQSELPFERPSDSEFCKECTRQGRVIAKLKVTRDRSKAAATTDLGNYNDAIAGLVEYSTTRGDPKLADKQKGPDDS